MTPREVARFTSDSLTGHRLRSALTLLAMSIGVAAVVVLTALGDGARKYVVDQFAALGTNLLIVLPGRSETTGGAPPLLGDIPRDLTVDDALALLRSPAIARVAPVIVGTAPAAHGRLEREVTVLGSTSEMRIMRHLDLSRGRFLPPGDPHRERPICVIGATIQEELFGGPHGLGRWVRIGDRRFRVVGVLASGNQSLGLDLGEVVIVPVASAQSLFDRYSLFRVVVEAKTRSSVERAKDDVESIIKDRHDGEDDVTVITQDAVLSTFDRVLSALTFGLAGIAAISLLVAGVLVMNVMLVSIAERTSEIGLLKALGATPAQIQVLFIAEAIALSFVGGLVGLAVGAAGAAVIDAAYPALSVRPPPWALGAAISIALATGVGFGVAPARRAARLDPVRALSGR